MFQNILAAVDGSENADRALADAVDLSACAQARLTIFVAAVKPPPFAYWAPAGTAGLLESAQSDADRIAADARDLVQDRVSVACIVSTAPVRQSLIRQILDGQHDLVVMDSRGRGAVDSVVLGSVSQYVLYHSPIPVLLVHATSAAQDEPSDVGNRTLRPKLCHRMHIPL